MNIIQQQKIKEWFDKNQANNINLEHFEFVVNEEIKELLYNKNLYS